jgi:hypothetical protein
VKIPIRAISSSFLADVPAVTVSAVQPVPPKYIQKLPSRSAVLRYRKVTHRPSVRSRVCSAERKSAILIKKCNDFGAGGVSVAIGELAPGLQINLDKVPKKYAGLDGTEIAISESQERMAVVVDPKDVDTFLKYANEENLEAVP